MKIVKRGLMYLSALAFIAIGIGHFVRPEGFLRIMPDYIPESLHMACVLVSGAAEIAGGVGLLIPRTRRAAAWGLVALLIAVFPANVHMAIHDIPMDDGGEGLGVWAWVRLPFQLVFIAWTLWATRVEPVDPR